MGRSDNKRFCLAGEGGGPARLAGADVCAGRVPEAALSEVPARRGLNFSIFPLFIKINSEIHTVGLDSTVSQYGYSRSPLCSPLSRPSSRTPPTSPSPARSPPAPPSSLTRASPRQSAWTCGHRLVSFIFRKSFLIFDLRGLVVSFDYHHLCCLLSLLRSPTDTFLIFGKRGRMWPAQIFTRLGELFADSSEACEERWAEVAPALLQLGSLVVDAYGDRADEVITVCRSLIFFDLFTGF